jgi:hypothetical protein
VIEVLFVRALGSAFYVGDVTHLPPAPPDFIEATREEIATGMPSFGSSFEPGYMTRLDPAR